MRQAQLVTLITRLLPNFGISGQCGLQISRFWLRTQAAHEKLSLPVNLSGIINGWEMKRETPNACHANTRTMNLAKGRKNLALWHTYANDMQ